MSEEKKYKREALLKSKQFSGIQQDFLAAILTEGAYTMTEARAAGKKALGGEAHGGR